MTRGLADTSVFIAREVGRALDLDRVPDQLAVSVITVGELRAGILAAHDLDTRDRRLATLTLALDLDPLPVDDLVASAWARLRVELRDSEQRMGMNDSWIAATAMALDIPVVTQDREFPDLHGLDVIQV